MRKIHDLNEKVEYNDLTWLIRLICGGISEAPCTRPLLSTRNVQFGIRKPRVRDWMWSRSVEAGNYRPAEAAREILMAAIEIAGDDMLIDEGTNVLYDMRETPPVKVVGKDVVREVSFDIEIAADDDDGPWKFSVIISRGYDSDHWNWSLNGQGVYGTESSMEEARVSAMSMAQSFVAQWLVASHEEDVA